MHSRRVAVTAMGIFAGALAVRCVNLGRESLWVDEGFSLRDSVHVTVNGAYRPIYYLVLRVWRHFGDGEAWLRFPSVFFGAAAVTLLYLLVRRVLGERIAVAAALIMTFAIPDLAHSQEVRMYAAASFLALLATLCLRLWYEKPSPGRLVAHVVTSVVAIATSPTAAVAVLPPVAFVLLHGMPPRSSRRTLALAWVLAAAALTPLVTASAPGLQAFAVHHRAWITPPGLREIAYFPARMLVPEVAVLGDGFLERRLVQLFGATCLALLAVALGQETARRRVASWLVSWVVLSAGVVFLVSHVVTPVWMVRYFHTLSPVVHVLFVVGVVAARRFSRAAALAAATLIAAVMAFAVARYFIVPQRDDWRGAAAWVHNLESRGDRVCLLGAVYAPAWEYYWREKGGCVVQPVVAADTGLPELHATLARVEPHDGRTFLVMRQSPRFGELSVQIARELSARHRLLGRFDSTKVAVLVLDARPRRGVTE